VPRGAHLFEAQQLYHQVNTPYDSVCLCVSLGAYLSNDLGTQCSLDILLVCEHEQCGTSEFLAPSFERVSEGA